MIDESKSEKENEDEGEREKRESGSSLLSASLGSSVGLMENEEREEEEVREERERNGDPLHTWPAWSKDVFRGWVSFFKLGIATALSLFIEWGSFEVNAAIAAYLGDVPLAAHAIMCNSVSVWYAFPLGVATATTALVGNMLGAGEPDRAKIAARIGMVIALIYGIFNGAFGLLYRDFLGLVFTSDAAVVKAISNVMFVMWLYGLVDAMKAVGTAILRGSGRPKLTVYGNILSCIFIGYPVALAMVFKGGFGLGGIWFGMSTAWMCAATIFTIIISKTNWQLEVLNAAKRNSEAEKSTEKGKERMKEGLLMSVVVKDEEKRGEEEDENENEESDDNNNGKKNGYNAVSVNG